MVIGLIFVLSTHSAVGPFWVWELQDIIHTSYSTRLPWNQTAPKIYIYFVSRFFWFIEIFHLTFEASIHFSRMLKLMRRLEYFCLICYDLRTSFIYSMPSNRYTFSPVQCTISPISSLGLCLFSHRQRPMSECPVDGKRVVNTYEMQTQMCMK